MRLLPHSDIHRLLDELGIRQSHVALASTKVTVIECGVPLSFTLKLAAGEGISSALERIRDRVLQVRGSHTAERV